MIYILPDGFPHALHNSSPTTVFHSQLNLTRNWLNWPTTSSRNSGIASNFRHGLTTLPPGTLPHSSTVFVSSFLRYFFRIFIKTCSQDHWTESWHFPAPRGIARLQLVTEELCQKWKCPPGWMHLLRAHHCRLFHEHPGRGDYGQQFKSDCRHSPLLWHKISGTDQVLSEFWSFK